MKIIQIVGLVLFLSACSSGDWVDTPSFGDEKCTAELVEGWSGRGNILGTGYCQKLSKSYTGEARCDGNMLQLKCE